LNLEASCSDVWYGGGLFLLEQWPIKLIKLHTQPGEQLIADKYAHVYEGGGAHLIGVSCCLLDGTRGMITAEQVAGVQ
jgi:hypothetical protein